MRIDTLFAPILACALVFVGAADAQAPRPKLALVIGNSDYNADGIVDISDFAAQKALDEGLANDLVNPANDATDIASALRGAGFKDVRIVKNGNRAAMDRALKAFSNDVKAAGDNALAILYFAGHGASIEGASYLVPVGARLPEIRDHGVTAGGITRDVAVATLMPDAYRDRDRQIKELFGGSKDAQSKQDGVPSPVMPLGSATPPAESRVIKGMEQRHAELGAVFYSVHDLLALFPNDGGATRLIILDNCRDNPFFKDGLNRSFSLITPLFSDFAIMTSSIPRETNAPIAIAAAEPGTVALDGNGRNSPFAAVLKRNIGKRDTTIDDLMQKVSAEVSAATKGTQHPIYLSRGSRTSDCIVSCPAVHPAPEAAPAP